MKKAIILYILLLIIHIAHVYEELVTNFVAKKVMGTEVFIYLNIILFLIPLTLFYFFYKGYRIGKIAAYVYPSIMILNGIHHFLMLLITGKDQDGYGGAITGIFLIITGVIMLYYVINMDVKVTDDFNL